MTRVALALILLAAAPSFARADRQLRFEVDIAAPVADVWAAWTTPAGVRSFLAPACNIDLRIDGAYDILFDPDAPAGQRGAEGMRILVLEPHKRFAFTWNNPPSLPAIRAQRTMVILELSAPTAKTTRLRLTQLGWGSGADWDKAFTYFARAWGDIVLPRLQQRFARSPAPARR
jgi:uncharacterized protein YndB with AHSA1/START domain